MADQFALKYITFNQKLILARYDRFVEDDDEKDVTLNYTRIVTLIIKGTLLKLQ